MAVRTIYLHIGAEKTGTSSIQAFWAANAEPIRRRYGLLYPADGPLFFEGRHGPILSVFLDPGQLDFVPPRSRVSHDNLTATMRDVVAVDNAHTLVLSAEHFSSRLRLPQISRLYDLLDQLPGVEAIKVVLYVRNQLEMAISKFSTSLKSGSRQWIDTRSFVRENPYYNHWITACRWAGVFGRENLIVREFTRRGDSVATFNALLGVETEWSGFRPVNRENCRLSLEEARLIRRINHVMPNWLNLRWWPTGYTVIKKMRRRLLAAIRNSHGAQGTDLICCLGLQERFQVQTEFYEDNLKLKHCFDLPFDLNEGFEPGIAATRPGAVVPPLDLGARLVSESPHRLTTTEPSIASFD